MTSSSGTRKLALDGTVNFRDLGGYPTNDGRHTAWGKIFRADGLHHLSDTDLEVLEGLGLSTVVDLRTADEVAAGAFPVDKLQVNFHHIPLMRSVGAPDDFTLTPGMLAATYLEMADTAASEMGSILALLSDGANLPAVFHCTAGKDRTGVTAALLLSVLGCPREVVVADYTLSHDAMMHLRERLATRYPSAREMIMAADDMFAAYASSIEGFLDYLAEHHGSVLGFAHHAGVTDAHIEALKDLLLVD